MKECKYGGMYQDACRTVGYCLQLKEYFNGDPTVSSETLENRGCPSSAIVEVKADEQKKGKIVGSAQPGE